MKSSDTEFQKIGAPAQRALASAGITRLSDLARWHEADVAKLHGMGPKAMNLLSDAMKKARLRFKRTQQQTQATQKLTVTQYLAAVPLPMRNVLAQLRTTIRVAAPTAEETISYGIPTYKLNGPLVHWAAFKNHASLIGVDKGLLNAFAAELAPFKTAGSTIRFTAESPLPAALVKKIVKYRVEQNRQLQKNRETLKSSKK